MNPKTTHFLWISSLLGALSGASGMAATLASGPMAYQVCVSDGAVNVRNNELRDVLFQVKTGERALPVQSWSEEKKTRKVDGKSVTFAQFEFPDRKGKSKKGWISQKLVTLTSQCAFNKKTKTSSASAPAQVTEKNSSDKNDSTLDAMFPTIQRPMESYLDGMRKFGANRSKGRRLHAACDLYRNEGERVQSVGGSKVVRDMYKFYQGTYALEVKLSNGKIVRYGEIKGKRAPKVEGGATLHTGDIVGYVGKVNSGCCEPMLHFEMYRGNQSGSLSQSSNKFSRRSDLINPTHTLQSWEMQTFGKSYQ